MKRVECIACGNVIDTPEVVFDDLLLLGGTKEDITNGYIIMPIDRDDIDGYDLCADVEACAGRGGTGYGIEEWLEEETNKNKQ